MFIWRAVGESLDAIFPGPVSEWTADQQRIVALQREIAGLFQMCSLKDVGVPPEHVLLDYVKLSKFREQVVSGEAAERTRHTHGWTKG